MYTSQELKQMIFIDIETSTQKETLQEVIDENPTLEEYWNLKTTQLLENQPETLKDFKDPHKMWSRMAGLYPEWGKIVCISMGQIQFDETGHPNDFKAVSFSGLDEADVLKEFMTTAAKIMQKYPKMQWVGHNIKGFDMPYLIKRSLINKVSVPPSFHLHKQKPWENCLLDTNEIWKFGGWNGASLSMICDLLQIPSPKQNMYGGEVSEAYYAGRLEEIKDYCEDDVIGTMNVMLKMSDMELVSKAFVPF